MSRVQLAINVTDLDRAIEFYSKLFDTAPAKVKPGYANFAIADPPLKLVLLHGSEGGTLNHLGVEVSTRADVQGARERLMLEGLPTVSEEGECCYALQDKVWATDPDGAPWEYYTVLADAPAADACAVDGCGCGTGCC